MEFYNCAPDELAHYGVLGMKWGVRKDRTRARITGLTNTSRIKRGMEAERQIRDAKRAQNSPDKVEKIRTKELGSLNRRKASHDQIVKDATQIHKETVRSLTNAGFKNAAKEEERYWKEDKKYLDKKSKRINSEISKVLDMSPDELIKDQIESGKAYVKYLKTGKLSDVMGADYGARGVFSLSDVKTEMRVPNKKARTENKANQEVVEKLTDADKKYFDFDDQMKKKYKGKPFDKWSKGDQAKDMEYTDKLFDAYDKFDEFNDKVYTPRG